jgi:Fe-S oxidoreductase
VDIATYKAEFLSHYWEGRIRPLHAYAFGFIDKWSRLASLWPGLVNLLTSTPGIRDVAKAAIGMAPQRSIPQFAPETFQSWFHKRPLRSGRSRVLLFPDTFNNYFLPRTARAAVQVLENAGYAVEVPRQHVCCGRPLYDHGLLDDAKEYLQHAMQVLEPYVDEGMPVIVLEPSCWSVLRDEIHSFFPESAQARKIMENTFLLSEFLMREGDFQAPVLRRNALVHAHCHHKAIVPGSETERSLLERMQLQVETLTDGCCGMAGAFGFEAKKYDVSVTIGEHAFLPAIRRAGPADLIVADGFSCRQQIAQLTDRRALHTAEVLQLALQSGLQDSEQVPEADLLRQEAKERRRSRARTLGILGGLAAAGLALALLTRTNGSDR